MYKQTIRPVLFLMEPEKVHALLVSCLKCYRHLPWCRCWIRHLYTCSDKQLIWNHLTFRNRIGLSAGFDKGAEIFDELADYGFGFIEVGTVTPDSQDGNPRPRIFRLPQCESLISRTGFNNPGLDVIKRRLEQKSGSYVLGVNINKNPSSVGEQAVADFLRLYKELHPHVGYFTLNWGSVDVALMKQVLQGVAAFRVEQNIHVPLLLKLPADITEEGMDDVIDCTRLYRVDGVIATGPTMERSYLKGYSPAQLQKIGSGGISGRGIGERSLKAVSYLRAHAGKSLLIVGAGGIITPADARRMLDAGANLIQIYSSFIYEGPGIVKKMIQEIK